MEELKQWCMEQFDRFIEKSLFYGWMKIAIPVILIFVSSCIAYALVNNTRLATAEQKITKNSEEIVKLNNEINRKLDLLIQHANEQEQQAKIDRIRNGGK